MLLFVAESTIPTVDSNNLPLYALGIHRKQCMLVIQRDSLQFYLIDISLTSVSYNRIEGLLSYC